MAPFSRILFAALLALTAIIFPQHQHTSGASITTILVNSTDDELNQDGDCSLREAVAAANSNLMVDACPAGSSTEIDRIQLPAGVYTLTIAGRGEDQAASGDLDLLESVTLTGAGQAETTITAGNIDRIFHLPFTNGSTVTITHMTLTSGFPGPGAPPQASGGAISLIANNSLLLQDVTLTGNMVSSDANNTLLNASGGALYNNGGTVTLERVSVHHNSGGTAAGIYNSGRMTVRESAIYQNGALFYGGGIQSNGSPGFPGLQLERSVVYENQAGTSGGGVYVNAGQAYIENSTIAENFSGSSLGGGVLVYYESSVMTATHTTIAGNAGGGIYNYHSQALAAPQAPELGFNIFVQNTLIANNGVYDCGYSPTQTEPPLSLGYSLDTDGSCAFGGVSDLINTNPQLGPLQDNGGPTLTQALLPGSPARESGMCQAPNGATIASDQRGVARPQGTACDRGAYEAVPGADADLALSMATTAELAAPGQPITFTLSVTNAGPNPAADLLLENALPAGTSFVSASGDGWACGYAAESIRCSRPSLEVTSAPAVQLVLLAPGSGPYFTNHAVVSLQAAPTVSLDPDGSNNQDSLQVPLTGVTQTQLYLPVLMR